MPEFCAPALGNRGTPVTIDAELPEKASGVLYALGGSGGGLTCYSTTATSATSTTCSSFTGTKIRSEDRLPRRRDQNRDFHRDAEASGPAR